MAEAIKVSAPISGTQHTLSFETGRLAGQADGGRLFLRLTRAESGEKYGEARRHTQPAADPT